MTAAFTCNFRKFIKMTTICSLRFGCFTFGCGTNTLDGTSYTFFTLHKLCAMTDNRPRCCVLGFAPIRYILSVRHGLLHATSLSHLHTMPTSFWNISVIHTVPLPNTPCRPASMCSHWISSGDATLNGRLPMICIGELPFNSPPAVRIISLCEMRNASSCITFKRPSEASDNCYGTPA